MVLPPKKRTDAKICMELLKGNLSAMQHFIPGITGKAQPCPFCHGDDRFNYTVSEGLSKCRKCDGYNA